MISNSSEEMEFQRQKHSLNIFFVFTFIITSGYLCLGKKATLLEMFFSYSEATVQYEKEKAGEDGKRCGSIISTFSKINLVRREKKKAR